MKELTLSVLESYLKETYKSGMEQSLFMKLVEEIGEVAEILNIRAGRKSGSYDTNNDLANELADVIHYAVAIAAINNINLSNTILEKDKKASIKYNRSINLEEYMKSSI